MNQIDPKQLYSEASENSVLGAMICYPGEIVSDVRVALADDPAFFFIEGNRQIFSALIELDEQGEGIDSQVLFYRLERKKAKIGVGIIADLVSIGATVDSISAHLRILREKKALRDILDACYSVLRDVRDGKDDSIVSLIDQTLERVNRVGDSAFKRTTRFADAVTESANKIVEHSEKRGGIMGLPTGFKRIDEVTGGWRPGQLIIVGARPNIGKTALALSFARALLRGTWDEEAKVFGPSHPGGMFSLEMTHEELCYRMLSAHGSLALTDFYKGELEETERQRLLTTAEQVREWPFHIDTQRGIDINQLRARARRWRRIYGIEWLMVDFLQLVRCYEAAKLGQTAEVGKVVHGIKSLAGELGIPIIVIAQLNRSVEDEEPRLHHLKDSGSIEEQADLVMLLHEFTERTEVDGSVKHHQLHIAKQRNGKRDVKIPITYLAWKTLFRPKKNDGSTDMESN